MSPLEYSDKKEMVYAILSAHSESPFLIQSILSKNEKALLKSLPQSTKWEVADLHAYFSLFEELQNVGTFDVSIQF